MFKLETNIKIKKMDTLDNFRRCYGLRLLNKEEVDEEEVVVMEAMLAFLAKYPRPRMPRKITLPKVLYYLYCIKSKMRHLRKPLFQKWSVYRHYTKCSPPLNPTGNVALPS